MFLGFFNQSWTSERGKGVPESPVFLGEEAGQLCPWEAAESEERIRF